jgi:hypothetical protein
MTAKAHEPMTQFSLRIPVRTADRIREMAARERRSPTNYAMTLVLDGLESRNPQNQEVELKRK